MLELLAVVGKIFPVTWMSLLKEASPLTTMFPLRDKSLVMMTS